MIKNIIFDFDGVLCESVNIKTEAFYEIYKDYGNNIAQKVIEYHLSNGGMSRFDKFKYYEETLLNKKITDEKIKKLSKRFSILVEEKIIKAPFVKGALDFLENYSNNYLCFIVSATPTKEIQKIAKEKKIDIFFKEILGSPTNKIEWIKYILNKYNLNKEETIFIGDANNDFIAAKKTKINFLLRKTDNNDVKATYSVNNLLNLNNVLGEYFG